MVRFIRKTDTLNWQNLQLRLGVISRLCENCGSDSKKGLAGTGGTIDQLITAAAQPQP